MCALPLRQAAHEVFQARSEHEKIEPVALLQDRTPLNDAVTGVLWPALTFYSRVFLGHVLYFIHAVFLGLHSNFSHGCVFGTGVFLARVCFWHGCVLGTH